MLAAKEASAQYVLENRFPLPLAPAMPSVCFFSTIRTLEEGRHAEASWLMADRLGGYFPQPQNPPTVSSVGTHSLAGIFASRVCAAEEILIDVFKGTVHKAMNPAVRRLMELILRDEVRRIAFGWQCLEAWAPAFTGEVRRNIERGRDYDDPERGVRRLPQPLTGRRGGIGHARGDRRRPDRLRGGPGRQHARGRMAIFPQFTRKICARFAPWGVHLPYFDHPKLGQV